MNTSFDWPSAAGTSGPAASAAIRSPITYRPMSIALLRWGAWGSVRKRPQPQLLLRDLPEPREPVRLDDEEEHDQRAEDHELELLGQRDRQLDAHRVRRVGQEYGQQQDEGRAQERPE